MRWPGPFTMAQQAQNDFYSDFEELIDVSDEIAVLSGGQIAAQLVTGGLTAGQLLAVAFGQDGAV